LNKAQPGVVGADALGLRFLVPSGDTVIGPCLIKYGEFALPVIDLFAELMEKMAPGKLLDVGANIGTICLPLAKRFPTWQFVAFEPQLPIFRLLSANSANNGLENVVLLPWCAGEKGDVVQFPAPPLHGLNTGEVGRGFRSESKVPVIMVALDSLGLADVRVLKIDVEGFDLEVLQGAPKLIAAEQPAILLEAKAGKKTSAAFALLRRAGYELYWFFAPFVTSKNERGHKVNPAAMDGDINALALPSGMPNPWDMPKIGDVAENWLSRQPEFHYMNRYR
jgi:FkbM family methyltransferase